MEDILISGSLPEDIQIKNSQLKHFVSVSYLHTVLTEHLPCILEVNLIHVQLLRHTSFLTFKHCYSKEKFIYKKPFRQKAMQRDTKIKSDCNTFCWVQDTSQCGCERFLTCRLQHIKKNKKKQPTIFGFLALAIQLKLGWVTFLFWKICWRKADISNEWFKKKYKDIAQQVRN